MKKIALTGGGTAGHVMPHMALLEAFKERGIQVFYVGSNGIEKNIVTPAGVPFYEIQAGKLRRYFSWQNFLDVAKIGLGFWQAWRVLGRERPDLVFSKGGFVSVPVAMAGFCRGIPVVSHESDLTPGLANKLIAPFAKLIMYCFPETASFLGHKKSLLTGIPIRPDLFAGDKAEGAKICAFPDVNRSCLLVMGGSQGAQRINDGLLAVLPVLAKSHNIIHITGKGKGIAFTHPRYKAFEFVGPELKHLFALADAVVSRSGANSIFEFLALKKPMLLIPLATGSRGDQIDNARSFAKNGWARVLMEAELTPERLRAEIDELFAQGSVLQAAQAKADARAANQKILDALLSHLA